jgi:hypothetical protein
MAFEIYIYIYMYIYKFLKIHKDCFKKQPYLGFSKLTYTTVWKCSLLKLTIQAPSSRSTCVLGHSGRQVPLLSVTDTLFAKD